MALKQAEAADSPPSYIDSIDQFPISKPATSQISSQLAITRTTHLKTVIDTLLVPLIRQRANQGLSRTIIALLPSNTFESTSDPKVLGLASGNDENLEHIQLEGSINRHEFWSQEPVICELRQLLKDSLSSPIEPQLKAATEWTLPSTPASVEAVMPAVNRSRGSFNNIFSRKASSQTKAVKPEPTYLHAKPTTRQQSEIQDIHVQICSEDLRIRTMSEFGLYETITRPTVLVEVLVPS